MTLPHHSPNEKTPQFFHRFFYSSSISNYAKSPKYYLVITGVYNVTAVTQRGVWGMGGVGTGLVEKETPYSLLKDWGEGVSLRMF